MGYGYGHKTFHGRSSAVDHNGDRVSAVLNNSDVAHKWAHMAQSFGRSSNGNFYFEGAALYSYGTHYLLGYRFPAGDDRHSGVALINESKASVTTSAHASDARRATRHLTVHHVPDLTAIRDALPHPDKDWARASIRSHVERHALALTSECMAFLLNLIGQDSSARACVAVIAAANEKAAKDAAEQKRREFVWTESEMNYAATRLHDDFVSGMENELAYVRKYGESRTLQNNLKQLRKLHRFASANGYAAKTILWDRVKYMVSAIEAAKEHYTKASRNEYTRQQTAEFRRFAERFAAYGIRDEANPIDSHRGALGQYDFQQWASICAWLLSWAPGLTRARPALTRTHALVRNEFERLRDENQRAYEAKRAREAAERFEREAADRSNWLAGHGGYWHGSDENGRALLRVVGDELQTSHGASVPLEHAIKAFRMIKFCRETGRTWQKNGSKLRVGVYQVDSIDREGNFVAGCHNIGWNEVERIAKQIGVFDLEPAITATHSNA